MVLMLEIEIKAKVKDLERMRKRILEIGGEGVGAKVQKDIYFNHPSRDFKDTDEALRLRKTGNDFSLTYKGPKIDKLTKTREEVKIEISNYDNCRQLLKKLGFKEVEKIEKHREYFELGDYTIMLDQVQNLGNFIEVEKRGKKYKPEEMVNFLKILGINEKDIERKSYLELMLEKIGRG